MCPIHIVIVVLFGVYLKQLARGLKYETESSCLCKIKRTGYLSPCPVDVKSRILFSQRVRGETSLFLTVKVSFKVAIDETHSCLS